MLEGTRVFDLSDESGFLAGKVLGDMGADVIKVEPPGGAPARRRGPFLGGVDDPERSLLWLSLNTSKRGITLDLEQDAGRDVFRRLLTTGDVLLETEPPGRFDELGLGFENLHAAFPRLVYCAMTPFGSSGPYAGFRGHDLVVVAMGGNAAMTGPPDRPPVRCSMPTSYYHAGPEAALGIATALYAREDTGRGQRVDVSLQETQLQAALSSIAQVGMHRPEMKRQGGRTGNTREIWPTKDGWVSYGLRGGAARLNNLIAIVDYMDECGMAPDWLRDMDWQSYNHNTLTPEEIERMEEAFGAFFRSKSMRELFEESLRRRILLAPCNDARAILEHPQLRFRELFVSIEYPELGASIEHPDFFARTSGRGIRIRRRAPRLGEHTNEILGEVGIAGSELADLRAAGVL